MVYRVSQLIISDSLRVSVSFLNIMNLNKENDLLGATAIVAVPCFIHL